MYTQIRGASALGWVCYTYNTHEMCTASAWHVHVHVHARCARTNLNIQKCTEFISAPGVMLYLSRLTYLTAPSNPEVVEHVVQHSIFGLNTPFYGPQREGIDWCHVEGCLCLYSHSIPTQRKGLYVVCHPLILFQIRTKLAHNIHNSKYISILTFIGWLCF